MGAVVSFGNPRETILPKLKTSAQAVVIIVLVVISH